jgi:LmbE family N-acetylglucosaminyl deacetylase
MKKMRRIKKILLLLAVFSVVGSVFMQAQQPVMMNSAELKIALKKLLSLGSVLYIAAHPDDENTAVLAYMSRERLMRTGYLSLTRGGGGQNLIGSEKGPLMSVLRTYELLAARKIDGAEQFFTRAVDFGYSKTEEESINIWGKENILGDMVFIIRKFRPDVLLTRFSTEKGGSGHGHHTASAILAVEAFHAAGNPAMFPEQLKYVSVWSPKRIFWNDWRPYWRPNEITPEEKEILVSFDVGAYNQLLGESYAEIAAFSRSMHKSQGFGAVPRRGQQLDYFNLLAGESAKKDLFEGIDTTWTRVPGSDKVRKLLEEANRSFQFEQPDKIIPLLVKALTELKALPESYWTVQKNKELRDVIRSCAGLWLEAIADAYTVIPGQDLKVTATVINRAGFPFIFKKIEVPGESKVVEVQQSLRENIPSQQEFSMKITQDQYTQPYWLREKPQKGIYSDANHQLKGLAVEPYPFNIKVFLEANGQEVWFEVPVVYHWRDPVEGEQIRDLVVSPPVTANFAGNVFYFPTKEPRAVEIILRSGPAPVSGELKLNLPSSWQAQPASISFGIKEPFTENRVSSEITPPEKDTSCDVTVDLLVGGKIYHHSQLVIKYSHIPILTLHPLAEVRLVRVDIKRRGERIGYIMGSGDDIPTYLTQVGYQVEALSDEDLRTRDLSGFDAVVVGVRAYNTRDILKQVQKRLLDYVSDGGNLIVQYNVNRELAVDQLGPYPLGLSRERVCEEDAAVTLLEPGHVLLNSPNKILPGDFDGWVQERGLYFADQWDPKYAALLSCHDQGEAPQKGGLLFAKYGKGVFVYTGYSFFRQLPEGVSGALKLFVNLISADGSK